MGLAGGLPIPLTATYVIIYCLSSMSRFYFINIGMLSRPLYFIEDFDILVKEIIQIVQTVDFEKNQIICQSLECDPDNWKVGVGSIEELEEKEEKKYSCLNSQLRGTYLERLINKHSAFRTRIMIMPPRQCYSVHADPTKRIHIPIITNDQCWMIWPTNNACFQLETKRAYITDTTRPHTFINGGTENRIHIVMCVED